MLKTISVSVLALAVVGFAAPAMAQTNPWAPGQTTVPITITVGPMVELFMGDPPAAVPLTIVDAGENQGSVSAVSGTMTHIHNVNVDVSAAIDGDIPNWTQFHILINPAAAWALPPASGAEKTLSWRRDGAGYIGADGAFPNQVSGTATNAPLQAFYRTANAPTGAVETVQYFADARNGMPNVGVTGFNVVWTIASAP